MQSQCEQILTDLKAGREITPMDALRDYGCLRLAARVGELREAGYRIMTDTVKAGDKRYARYWLA